MSTFDEQIMKEISEKMLQHTESEFLKVFRNDPTPSYYSLERKNEMVDSPLVWKIAPIATSNTNYSVDFDKLEKQLFEAYVLKHLIPERIIYNQKTTIVYWKGDDTKTVVHCAENDDFTEDGGFCAALAKKIYGERSKYMKFVKNATHQIKREYKKKLDKTDIV